MAEEKKLSAVPARDLPVFLALALCPRPVSIDEIVSWGVARPVEIWRALEEGRKGSHVVEKGPAGSGQFAWVSDPDRNAAILDAPVEVWQRVLVHADLVASCLEQARVAVQARDRAKAKALFRGLVNAKDPSLFPGGERGYMQAVLESCQPFVHADWRPAEVLDRALAIAESAGDQAALAGLLVVRGAAHFYAGDLRRSSECVERAREIGIALDRPEVLQPASVAAALARIFTGRIREGIEVFEESLGDIPAEVFPALDQVFPEDRLTAFEFVGSIAYAYCSAGQPTRGVDLLHRAESMGLAAGHQDVVNLARMYLLGLCSGHGDFEPARRWAEEGLRFWQAEGNPYFAWFTAVGLADLRSHDGDLAGAREALLQAEEARRRSGFAHYFGRAFLEVLERLERGGSAPIEGMTLPGEIERILGWFDDRMKGVAHQFAARRLLAAGTEEGVLGHLVESERLLRASGAVLDLSLALQERADWEERRGGTGAAAKFRKEAEDLRNSIPPLVPKEGDAEKSRLRIAEQVIEIGRLSAMGHRPGLWGELAARLCARLGAERCAIVEAGDPPRLLAVRGGSRVWADALVADITGCCDCAIGFVKPPWNDEDRNEQGQLLVIPFSSPAFHRTGWVALENRRLRPAVGPADRGMIEALGAQVSVLFENASLWQELQAARARLEQENRYYRQQEGAAAGSGSIVGHSPALRRTLDLVERVAPTDTTVLVTGETGAGKELVAREIHRRSGRADGPFIAVHIASLAPGLVASGLFGHEKGAFTGATAQVKGRFELADGGTLFLDEIGELGPEEQVRLLRVLQEGVFERVGGTKPIRSDFRLVAATNRDLASLAKAGRFREDLYYRLNVFPILMPPLRDRAEDVPTLALYFMEQCGRRLGRKFEGIGETDMARLVSYPWPGNVRELMHCIERAAVLSDGPRLRIPPLDAAESPSPAPAADTPADAPVSLAEAERRHIRKVLQHTQGRINGAGGAAEILGLNPSTLHFRIGKLGLKGELARARRTDRGPQPE